MPKKSKATAPTHIKDPKKVAAGKARAANAIRVNGKLTSNSFLEKIQQDAQDVGAKDPFQFYLQNQKVYENLYQNATIDTNFGHGKTKEAIKNFNGRIFKNGREVKKATALKAIADINQLLKSEHNVVEFFTKLEMGTYDGKLHFKMPSIKDIQKKIKAAEIKGLDIGKLMSDEYKVKVVISDPTKKKPKQEGSASERKRVARAKYRASEAGKAAKARYKKTEAGKAEKARYRKTTGAKANKAKLKKQKKKT